MGKLIRSELRKILWHPWVLLLLVGALAAGNVQLVRQYSYAPEYYEYGKEFMASYGGILTREKYEGIKALRNVQREDMMISYESMWSSTAMSDIEYLVSFAGNRDELLSVAIDNVARYQEAGLVYEQRLNEGIYWQYRERPNVQLVAIGSWERYFEFNSFVMFPLLVITLLLATIFTNEKESGCEPVLAASVSGRKGVFKSKVIAAVLISAGIMLLFVVVRTAVSICTEPLTHWQAPVQSLALFERCPYMITIGQMVVIRGVLLCVLAMVHGLFVSLLSSLLARNISGIIVGVFWYLATYFWYPMLKYYGVMLGISVEHKEIADLLGVLRRFYYPMLSESTDYLEKTNMVNVFGYPVPALTVCLCVTLLVVTGGIWLAYRLYMRNDLSYAAQRKVK